MTRMIPPKTGGQNRSGEGGVTGRGITVGGAASFFGWGTQTRAQLSVNFSPDLRF